MASSKEYLNYILEQLDGLPEITHRMMMGEYMVLVEDVDNKEFLQALFEEIYEQTPAPKPNK